MRDLACADCVVTALVGPMPEALGEHQDALAVLADVGLVKPLRLIKGGGEGSEVAAVAQ